MTLRIALAVALLRKGAAAEVRPLLSQDTNPLARYKVALAEAKLGRVARAMGILEQVLRQRPGFTAALLSIGGLASGNG